MELWLLLGALGFLSHAISTSIDKYFMKNKYNPVSTNTFKMFFDGAILLVIGLLFFNLNFSSGLFFWSLVLGGLYAVGGILYFTALKSEDVEIVVPYLQSSTVLLVFIGAVILFREIVNAYNYIGIALILVGMYAVLSKNGVQFPKIDKALRLLFIAVIFVAAYSLLAKKLLFDVEPINLAIMMYFSCTIILACYISLSRKRRKLFDIKSSRIITAAFFGAIGTFLLYSALSVGNASKVYPMAGLQSVFVFIIASFFLREKFHWHSLIGTLVVFAGIFFISL